MSSTGSSVRVPGPLVSVDWLKQHLNQVRVVDGSWYMPNEKQDPHANFLKERIPGAVFFDLEACTSKEGANANLPHMLPSKEQFARYMSELGLKREDAIVLYDGKGIFSAPRIRLTLNHFGADNVAILDGGLKEWLAAGEKTESGPSSSTSSSSSSSQSTSFEARDPPQGFVRDIATVRANSESNAPSFQLVDARSQGRFDGIEPEPRPGLPSGHIEGAISVPFTALLETKPSGATAMKSVKELWSVFNSRGVDPESLQPIVASCGSGVTACVVLLGLELCGRKQNVGLYDGSWTEWALNPNNKIITNKK